jgi:cytosine deaminase
MITDNSARTMCLQGYGIEVGNAANFILLEGHDDYSVLRQQGEVLLSVRHGEIIMQRQPSQVITQPWISEAP